MNPGRHKLTYENFVQRAREKHAGRYDYPEAGKYEGARTKMVVICREHGEFRQDASNHLHGNGCPKCGRITSVAASSAERKGRAVGARWAPQEPFGALGGLYKLPFWS